MITTDGKQRIKRFLAGQGGTIAASMAVGIGNAAETLTDARLNFEIERFNIELISYDFVGDALVFKGIMPADLSGKIYEVGLWSTETNFLANGYGSRIITSFDSATEIWDIETMESIVARAGNDSLKHTPAASSSTTSIMGDLDLDLSGYSGSDQFLFAYNVDNANVASIRYRFVTDASNYYDFNLGAQTAGYKIAAYSKASAVVTGVPDWSNITGVQVTTTATAGGVASMEYDGIRIEDVDTLNTDYVLVARKVLATPMVKQEGRALDFEYALTVTL